MPNTPVQAAAEGLPTQKHYKTPQDRRRPTTRLCDEIRDLVRMCSINTGEIEQAFSYSRGTKDEIGNNVFRFADTWVDDICFLSREIEKRALRLQENLGLIDPEEAE